MKAATATRKSAMGPEHSKPLMPIKRGRMSSKVISTSCLDREMMMPFRGCLIETIVFMETGRTPARTTRSMNSCM